MALVPGVLFHAVGAVVGGSAIQGWSAHGCRPGSGRKQREFYHTDGAGSNEMGAEISRKAGLYR